ncbi:hypothetical protein [Streptomyces sp. NPDC007063]|uniref:hypothetical protein n=1 Tax=Streptomyces sp. NPDC007063 TaxID=3364772 RepID=UPI0036A542F8
MATHSANPIPPRLSMWRRVREYAVPLSMIENATARRAVGDWAGACAAARVDVDLDLRAVRDRHGTDLAHRLRADLRRLAPDLLRWHLPRIAPDGRLRPGLTLSLALYPEFGLAPLQLVARTPPARADAGQRVSLALWEGPGSRVAGQHPHPHPDRRFRLDLHRHLWDAARSGELARRCGTGTTAPRERPGRPLTADSWQEAAEGGASPWAVERWAAEGESLLRAEERPARGPFAVRLGTRRRAVFELVAPDDSHAPMLRVLREALPRQQVAALPVLPEAAARVLPDLELLRAGLITTGRLHPLVAAALAAPGPVPATGPGGPSEPVGPGSENGDPHRVVCRGEVHRIALRAGVLTAVDHDPAELRREEMLVALGGPALPCLRAIDAAHHAPQALPAIRERLDHGDVTGALDVVGRLLGPGAVLREGPLREALESAASRRVEHGLFRSVPAALRRAGAAPGAVAAASGITSDPGRAEAGHRPRLDRRTPSAISRKRSTRTRPRTALSR